MDCNALMSSVGNTAWLPQLCYSAAWAAPMTLGLKSAPLPGFRHLVKQTEGCVLRAAAGLSIVACCLVICCISLGDLQLSGGGLDAYHLHDVVGQAVQHDQAEVICG